MNDFYELLMRQPEPEAQNIALSLEIYCRGSLDTFAHRTNVDVDNRLTVYDIKDIGSGMKELGLQVCLNHVWNKIIENQSKGKRTWFYIDEFHILTKTRSSSEFLEQVWKRARKWGGVPTAITQNVGDLFKTDASMAIINNCEFIMMLSQSPSDRLSLAEMYHISDAQLNYITNSPPGQGLLYTGETIVPFVDHFPKDTELYKIMSSKADERKIG
jgi:type IV secretory pathway VirB4 component